MAKSIFTIIVATLILSGCGDKITGPQSGLFGDKSTDSAVDSSPGIEQRLAEDPADDFPVPASLVNATATTASGVVLTSGDFVEVGEKITFHIPTDQTVVWKINTLDPYALREVAEGATFEFTPGAGAFEVRGYISNGLAGDYRQLLWMRPWIFIAVGQQ